ncbi:MAG: D-glycero-beta-D-manno-heptose 1-phosphate adenylyltransferase [Thermodesulfobacteriota bacterium]|nr:D-glycero-beta-D-manno-heptose 1-phosphate adenylyltransferase [Thermodesulfobacteriota bacterium]
MKAGIVQLSIEIGNTQQNLERAVTGLENLGKQGVRLAVLPEMWATGFAYDKLPALTRETPQLLSALQSTAGNYNMAIAGSLPEEENGRYYNTAFLLDGKQGLIGKYRKTHPFPPTGEDRYFTKGHALPVFETDFGKVGIIICYDLRFPEICRHLAGNRATFIIVCAEWPLVRLGHWQTLTTARAIENQCFVVAANCRGTDGKTVFAGHSRIIGPDGFILFEADEKECLASIEIDSSQVETTRNFFNTVPSPAFAPSSYQDKIMSRDAARELITRLKKEGKRIVFTNGCFDILHVGHARYLAEARTQGDFLIIAVNSDESVRAIKGPDRPINNEENRAGLLAALATVDAVILFSEETPYNLIEALKPDVLVKGSDWEEEDIVGADMVKSCGGRVVRIPLIEGASTTETIERILTAKEVLSKT